MVNYTGPCHESTFQLPTSALLVMPNVVSPFLCQNECQQRGDCLTFAYDKVSQNCYFNPQTPGTKVVLTTAITGPKTCGFNTYLCMSSILCLLVDFCVVILKKLSNAVKVIIWQIYIQCIILAASCFWENIEVNVASLRYMVNVYTASDCQAICASQNDCSYFSFDKMAFFCHIKGTQFSTAYNSRYTSGPKTCIDGKHILTS